VSKSLRPDKKSEDCVVWALAWVSKQSCAVVVCPNADPHPGNVAVDAVNGGRLIYYDFGMMGSIPGGVRGGLMELFYGVYERDADRCGGPQQLVQHSVLQPRPAGAAELMHTGAVLHQGVLQLRLYHKCYPLLIQALLKGGGITAQALTV